MRTMKKIVAEALQYQNIFRRLIWYKRGLYCAAAVFVAAAVTFLFVCSFGFARTNAAESSRKYYTSIMIEPGDTLWSIAYEYITPEYNGIEEYIAELRRLNHLDGDKIHAGRYLAVPCFRNGAP